MGLVVAALSITGIVIWYRKRLARVATRSRTAHRPEPGVKARSQAPAE
jgi:hypothetical protein